MAPARRVARRGGPGHRVVAGAADRAGAILPAVPRLDRVLIGHDAHHVAGRSAARSLAVGGLRRRWRRSGLAGGLAAGHESGAHPRHRTRRCRRTGRSLPATHRLPSLPGGRCARRTGPGRGGSRGSRARARGRGGAGAARRCPGPAAQHAQIRRAPALAPGDRHRLGRAGAAVRTGGPAPTARPRHRRGPSGRRGCGRLAGTHRRPHPRSLLRRHPRLLGGDRRVAGRPGPGRPGAGPAGGVVRRVLVGAHAGRALAAAGHVPLGRARCGAAVQRGQHPLARRDPGAHRLRPGLAGACRLAGARGRALRRRAQRHRSSAR